MYESNRESINNAENEVMPLKQFEDNVTLEQIKSEYQEAIDIFPALHKYKSEHNESNLQKLCVEVVDFCKSIYASTRNENERNVYRKTIDKLKL